MSEYTLGQGQRLNDSLERRIMDTTLNNGETLSFIQLVTRTGRFTAGKLAALGAFILHLTEQLNAARAKSAEFSRSHW